jgi:hypothetical protein
MGWSRLQQPGTAYRAYCLIVACFVPLLRRTIVYHLVQPSFFTTSWCFLFVCIPGWLRTLAVPSVERVKLSFSLNETRANARFRKKEGDCIGI